MTLPDARTRPLDAEAVAALAATGLDMRVVANDGEEFESFFAAIARGFLDAVPTAEQIDDGRDGQSIRRLVGVFDPRGVHRDVPVATVDSWTSELTTQPGRTVPFWAISGVTVAPTHRRRGIARAMLTGELRAAKDAGYALAGLTVTEATIYGRWGFSPAVYAADWKIDAKRVRWTGPRPDGRLDFIDQAEIPDHLDALHARTRLQRPGGVAGWAGQWRRIAGLRPGADEARKVRAVTYRDAGGDERGILVYALGDGEGYGRAAFDVRLLLAETDEAGAALWRFALEHDLVGNVTASLQPVDAPVRWMISDQRAASVSVTDHGWLRVLDVPGALESRTYAGPMDATLEVDDALGLAGGLWRMSVDAQGAASVVPADGTPDARVDVGALASLLLGGVRADTLAAAGLVDADAAVVRALERAFAPAATPALDIWY
jgi:predicted acetyltransferase